MSHWTLVFRAEGNGPPVEIRVRKLLKTALWVYRLRCVKVWGDDSTELSADVSGHFKREKRDE